MAQQKPSKSATAIAARHSARRLIELMTEMQIATIAHWLGHAKLAEVITLLEHKATLMWHNDSARPKGEDFRCGCHISHNKEHWSFAIGPESDPTKHLFQAESMLFAVAKAWLTLIGPDADTTVRQ
jgi:hypothetical protein